MTDRKETTITLSHKALSHLATLCDARAHNLRKMISDGIEEDETADAEMDITYLDGLAEMLRGARDGLKAAPSRS